MLLSILGIIFLVGVVWGLIYCVKTSDRQITAAEKQRDDTYLWYTTRR